MPSCTPVQLPKGVRSTLRQAVRPSRERSQSGISYSQGTRQCPWIWLRSSICDVPCLHARRGDRHQHDDVSDIGAEQQHGKALPTAATRPEQAHQRALSKTHRSSCLLACCLIAPYKGNNTQSVPAAGGGALPACCGGCGGRVPHHSAARPTCVYCQCMPHTGRSQAVGGSLFFGVFALGLVLACPGLPERSQRAPLNRRPTSCRSRTPVSLVHFHFLQSCFPLHPAFCC
jgi:hypothetical protein